MVGKRKTNRKRNPNNPFPTALAGVLSLLGLVAISYLCLCSRCEALAREIKTLEVRHAELQRRKVNEEYKWSNLRSLKRVEEALARFQIPMSWPRQDQVVHIARPVDIGLLPSREGWNRQVARHAPAAPDARSVLLHD